MKNKENIFEELNKMKGLMVAKAGTVISEQVSTDVGVIMQELNKGNSDEQKIVNIVKKYKTKPSFQDFLRQYKSISGKDFGEDVRRALQPGQDKVEINDLKNHLATLGITMADGPYVRGKALSYTFGGLTADATKEEVASAELAWKDPKVSCVLLQPNAVKKQMSSGIPTYNIGQTVYYHNGRKKLPDETMASYNCSTEFKTGQQTQQTQQKRDGQTSQSVNNRFAQSASSLGIQNAKMDLQTLQTMLKSLEGGEIAAAPTQGTPDLAQLTAALNQLNA